MANDRYALKQLKNGAWCVQSLPDDEVMHPGLGPVAEAEALYVRQLRVPERLALAPEPFVIWDIGLGAAANAIAAIENCRAIAGQLRIISFDHTVEPLHFALEHATRLNYLEPHFETCGQLLERQRARFAVEALSVEWQLRIADFPALLRSAEMARLPKPDAIFFDPYSPAKNAAMWTLDLFESLFGLLAPGRPCALATYSRSTMARVALLLAGFYVGRGLASGRKEETTVAANDLALIHVPLGVGWLEQAGRSGSAEPLRGDVYRQERLSEATKERLQSLEQLQVCP